MKSHAGWQSLQDFTALAGTTPLNYGRVASAYLRAGCSLLIDAFTRDGVKYGRGCGITRPGKGREAMCHI